MKRKKNHRIYAWTGSFVVATLIIFLVFILPGILIPPLPEENITSDTPAEEFFLQPGDILVRPNWNWLPGTSRVVSGRNFGHLAIVVQGAAGATVGEILQKAVVIEALLFDQATRKFIFGSPDIVRQTAASTSFGERFRGRRYLLRMALTGQEQEWLLKFLTDQLKDDRYTALSFRKYFREAPGTKDAWIRADHDRWNCATLAWYAFIYATGRDIDANGGILVYPNDIIRSKHFDLPGKRIRF
ncbi:MAG: hypothetical protein WCO93_10210 [bacterium]